MLLAVARRRALGGVTMARQQLTEAVGIAKTLHRIAAALGWPGYDVSVEPPS